MGGESEIKIARFMASHAASILTDKSDSSKTDVLVDKLSRNFRRRKMYGAFHFDTGAMGPVLQNCKAAHLRQGVNIIGNIKKKKATKKYTKK